MCEVLSLGFVDTILSFVIFGMNVIYVIWGWFMPNEGSSNPDSQASLPEREDLNDLINKLKSYTNFVTYTDSIAIPLKILLLVLIRYACCKKKETEQEDSVVTKPKLFNFNIFPTKRTNVQEV